MKQTLRHVLMSTSLGLAMAALQVPGAGSVQAQDSSTCMQDVEMLREQASLGKGGDTTIEASANAAEEACLAGDYGQASAYIADAERRINLREAQRDDVSATAANEPASDTTTDAVGIAALDADDDTVADDAEDFADDVGDEISDVADDAGDELDDIGEDIEDTVDDVFGEDEDLANTPATIAATNSVVGESGVPGQPSDPSASASFGAPSTSTSLSGETEISGEGGATLSAE